MWLLRTIFLLLSVQTSLQASRELFEQIATYTPKTLVTSQSVIDLDQKLILDSLTPGATEGFDEALSVYANGAHSAPVARLTLSPKLTGSLSKGSLVEGIDTGEDEVFGYLADDYGEGTEVIDVAYKISESQSDYVKCQVGGSQEVVTEGCFKASDRILVEGRVLNYSYDIWFDNVNDNAIKLFSTHARKRFFECDGPDEKCPYIDYDTYYTFYADFDYADAWVSAAAGGTQTSFARWNADFRNLDEEGKFEAFKTGTVYLHFFMQVIGQMEKAIDKCMFSGLPGIDLWDEAVAYYTGSLVGSNGLGAGVLLYSLADRLCILFNTCGEDSDESSGKAYVNHVVMEHFISGQASLDAGNCDDVITRKNRIVEMMLVPLVQVVLYEAHARSVGRSDGAKSFAAGATAAAAILPYVGVCNETDASIIYDQMRVDRGASLDFPLIKSTLEKHYQCMGILCGEVGGLYDPNSRSYFVDAAPCNAESNNNKRKKNKRSGSDNLSLAIGIAVGGALVVAIIVALSNLCGVKAAPRPTGLEASSDAQLT